MKAIAIIVGTLAVLGTAKAQWPPNTTMMGSASGQFFVSARNLTFSPRSLELGNAPEMVTLEPALLAVSCERIKRALLRQLDTRDQWQGKIFVVLRPARSADDPITVVPERLGGNWDCGMELPDALNRNRFVEAIVRACLLEMANRNATDRSAEIPEWLVRGMTRQLLGSSEIKLILPPPLPGVNVFNVQHMTMDFSDAPHTLGDPTRMLNPLAAAAAILRTNSPLTFDQLSWPTDEQLSDDTDVFGSSAQLFVSELLHLPNGPTGLRAMLGELPDYLNWQLAFLNAFHGTFQEPLDVEKWWALNLTEFSGRDLMHLLTPEESWNQLNAIFQFPVEVQIGEAPPMRTDITFQTIIRGWSRTPQLQMLKKKLWELDLLRLRAAPDFIPLVDGYRETLQNYYKKRSASLKILAGTGPIPDKAVSEALERLDALDAKRANMQPERQTPVAAAEIAPVAP
ncbi:MAG TPA: hypothetical protein VG938_20105 [Verrucomicrobiae bacterium]|jgi:hypothetical protein|nr:hypothetical protein [Verrucomicrobiae bacterium]